MESPTQSIARKVYAKKIAPAPNTHKNKIPSPETYRAVAEDQDV